MKSYMGRAGGLKLRGKAMLAFAAAAALVGTRSAQAGLAYWDINQSALGAGGPVVTGAWDGVTPNWNPAADGTGIVAIWNQSDTPVFSAGTDGTGSSKITITGDQTATGLTIEEGSLSFTGGTLNLANGSIVSVPTGITTTFGGTILGGTSGFTKTGAGTLKLTNASSTANNTFSGNIVISGGTLSFPSEVNTAAGSQNPLGAYPSAVSAAAITLSNGGVISTTNTSSAGTGSFILANRGITIGAGGGSLDVASSAASLVYAGKILGTARWTKSGPGTLALTGGAQSYSGGFTVSGGILIYSTLESAADAAGTSLRSSGTVPAAVTPDYVILDGGTMRLNNNGNGATWLHPNKGITLTANGGGISVPDSADHAAAQSANYTGQVSLASGVTSATLFKRGEGEFRAQAAGWANTKLEIDGGLYKAQVAGPSQADTAFGAVPGSYVADAIFINGTGGTRSTGGAAIGVGASVTTPANRGITIGANGVTVVTNAAWTVNSIITGAGGLAVNENGWDPTAATSGQKLILKGANTYQGATRINNGTLEAQGGAAIPDNSTVSIASATATHLSANTQAVLQITNAETIGSLAGGGGSGYGKATIADTLTTGGNNSSTTFDGVISGAGALVKTGTGTFTLTATNTYGGGTTISGGVLAATGDSSLGGGGGALNFNGGTFKGPASFSTSRTVNVSATGGTIDASNGDHAITGGGDTTIGGNVLISGGAVTFSRSGGSVSITPGVNLTVSPGAALYLGGSTSATSNGSNRANIVNNGGFGAITSGQAVGTISGTGAAAVADGASLTADSVVQNSLVLNGSASLALRQNGNSASVIGSLTVGDNTSATTAVLDLNDNDLVLPYSGSSPITSVHDLLVAGYSGGAWNGKGIASSAANADASQNKGLGFGEATDVGVTSLDSVSITGNAVIVKYTYYGDSSLDGKVDLGNDFNLFLSGFMAGTGNWEIGDYNYDGQVNMADFTLFLDGYAGQGGNLGQLESFISGTDELTISQKAQLLDVVPEPSSVALIGLAAAGIASRRRRKN